MTTISTIYTWEHAPSDAAAGRLLVIVSPRQTTRALVVRDALTHLAAIRNEDDRFESAVLACDTRCDWPSMHTRALVARALLALVAPGGQFLLHAPQGFPERPLLLALLEALTQLSPRGDVSFGIQFDAALVGTNAQYVRKAARDVARDDRDGDLAARERAIRNWN